MKTSLDVKRGAENSELLFVCLCTAHDLGYLGPVFTNCSTNAGKAGITWPSENLDTRVRSHFKWNVVLKTLDYFLCLPSHALECLNPVFPKCSNA